MNFGTVDYSRLSNLRENIGKAIENQAAIDAKLREQQKIDARKAREAQLMGGLGTQLAAVGNAPERYNERNTLRRNVLGQIAVENGEADKALQYSIEDAPKPVERKQFIKPDGTAGYFTEDEINAMPAGGRFPATYNAENRTVPIIVGDQAQYVKPRDVANIPGAQIPQQVSTIATNTRQEKTLDQAKTEKNVDRSSGAEENDKKRIAQIKTDIDSRNSEITKLRFNANAEGATKEQKVIAEESIKALAKKNEDDDKIIKTTVRKYPNWQQPEAWGGQQQKLPVSGKQVVRKAHNKTTNQTQFIYNDGTTEIKDGLL